MNSRIPLLAIIAVVQVLIVGGFLLSSDQGDAEGSAWFSLEPSAVTSLAVSDQDESITLTLSDSGWFIEGLPADEEKISNLLSKLAGLEAPWPVATTSDAIDRFEVSEDNFQRRVLVKGSKSGNAADEASDDGEALLDLLLGTSPGYQRVHARLADAAEVYSVALSNFELPANVDGWLDKALLTVTDDVTHIELGDVALRKGDEGWLVNGEAANQESAATYANRLKTMRVLGVYFGDTQLESLGKLRVNDEVELEILREVDEGEYVLRSPEFDRGFRLSTYIAEQLLMTDVDFAAVEAVDTDES